MDSKYAAKVTSWTHVCSQLLNIEMGRDFRVVMGRLRFLQKQRIHKKGRWSDEEDLQLLKVRESVQSACVLRTSFQSVLRHGLCWESVSEDVPSRSGAQCRERFVYSLQPGLERQRGAEWPAEDTERLEV